MSKNKGFFIAQELFISQERKLKIILLVQWKVWSSRAIKKFNIAESGKHKKISIDADVKSSLMQLKRWSFFYVEAITHRRKEIKKKRNFLCFSHCTSNIKEN